MRIGKKIILFLFFILLISPAFAKRPPPEEVPPVIHDGIIYKAPVDDGEEGYIEAYDANTNKLLWKKTIFKNFFWFFIEGDVQCVYIKKMYIEGDNLVIINEKDKTYYEPIKKPE